MTRTVAVIQARMGSLRLPGKVLQDIAGTAVLGWVVRAAESIHGVDATVVATSTEGTDDAIALWCADRGVPCHRGSEDNLLSRYLLAAEAEGADTILRLTADCPFLDPHVCGQVLALLRETGADYAGNCDPATWPDGLDCEAFTIAALHTADSEAIRKSDREHVTPFMRNSRNRFKVESLICPIPGLHARRWTLDTPEDLEFLRQVSVHLPSAVAPSFLQVLTVLKRYPDLRSINESSGRNEGYKESVSAEQSQSGRRFTESNAFLDRAKSAIPLGSQTFSKSHIQYPKDNAPLFLTHGNGGRVWDVDGNEYVDLVSGLLPVILGYRDPDVDYAIRNQLTNGISFSQATKLETELAERLIELIPCAEMVRFGKNGTDATSAAVRLARAYTGREHIAVCGYHGWQDWYIGSTTRHLGVPQGVRALTHRVPYNDLEATDRLFRDLEGRIAAFVLEPMTTVEPAPGYLADLKSLVHGHGAVLVFDEIITGFRYRLGGAQELFGVTPDLAAFGKAMGNGMPISAIVGRRDIMCLMEDVFISGTFGGETLSLAAAIAVVDKMRRESVIDSLWKTGEDLAAVARAAVSRNGLDDVISFCGKAPWMVLGVADHPAARKDAIRTRLQYEMLQRGVLILSSHNICYAHNTADMAFVAAAYAGALSVLSSELSTGSLEDRLPCPTIEPVFQVR